VLALVAVTLISLWPAVEHFRTKALADRLDATVFTWAWWAMPRALFRGENPFHTDLMFHPVGTDLALTTTTPLVSLLTWPIRAALGPEAQINSVQLAAGFLAGLGAYLLARRVVGARGPALFAGVAFTLTTSRFVHVPGHFNLIHTAVLPFGALQLLRFTDAPSLRRALALGAFTGATFLIDPQLTLLVLALFVPLAVVHRTALRGQLRHLAAGAALAGVVALPLLWPMAQAMSADEMNPAPPVEVSVLYSASPLAWVMPPSDHVLGDLAGERSPSRDREGEVYPGLLVVALAIVGVGLMAPERRRGWPAVALVGVVLSFGPRLIAYDTTIDVPMPYALLRVLPGLDLQRVPGRFALVGVLGLVVLAAGALAEMARRSRERASLLVGAAVVLTVLDLLVTGLPQRDGTIPEPYHAIADDAGDGAVLELPVQWYTGDGVVGIDDRADFSFLLHATVHGQPIVSGGVSRYPDRRLDALRKDPLYEQVLALQGADGFDAPARFDREDLVAAGIGYVAYDRGRPLPEALAYFEGLDLPVLADDGTVIVWSTGAG
jgi:hypothetical protein